MTCWKGGLFARDNRDGGSSLVKGYRDELENAIVSRGKIEVAF